MGIFKKKKQGEPEVVRVYQKPVDEEELEDEKKELENKIDTIKKKGTVKIVEIALLESGLIRSVVISNKQLGQLGDEFEV